MKTYLILSVAIVILLCGSLLALLWLDNSAEKLTAQINPLKLAMIENNWQAADGLIVQINDDWQKLGKYWPVFVTHSDIAAIEESLRRLNYFIAVRSSIGAGEALRIYEFRVLSVPDSERITWGNIF
ncbi:MAG: DUF4363 family protein [Clostridia bacterium]|nr:DUF4363 family protein [Clostridia bacterium]MDD4798031.1 DUF4363 family protein [Clostridia bacterium]